MCARVFSANTLENLRNRNRHFLRNSRQVKRICEVDVNMFGHLMVLVLKGHMATLRKRRGLRSLFHYAQPRLEEFFGPRNLIPVKRFNNW